MTKKQAAELREREIENQIAEQPVQIAAPDLSEDEQRRQVMSAVRAGAVRTMQAVIQAIAMTEQAKTAISVGIICTATIDEYIAQLAAKDARIAELEKISNDLEAQVMNYAIEVDGLKSEISDLELYKHTGGYGL